ncbi:MAG: peptidylprolyl isomerase [Clostridia bacterium]|nr:peptidylprolyl isomerase [Clostridia bacterium]
MKKILALFLLLALLPTMLLPVTGCKKKKQKAAQIVLRIRGEGEIVIALDDDNAPITCGHLRNLVAKGFYTGLTFHRVADLTGSGGWIIQGGDPDGDGTGGAGVTVKGEFSRNGVANTRSHVRGTVSMARSSSGYDTASSQFFICAADCTFLDGNYAAFGYVVEGMEIVDRLAALPTDANNRPLTPPVIESAELR